MASNHERDDEFIRTHAQAVYTMALRLTGNVQDAEDLSQDALLQALKGLEGFRGESAPATWLYRIVMNAWKNRLRAKKRRKFIHFISLEMFTGKDQDREPGFRSFDGAAGNGLEANETRKEVEKALQMLDDESRAILVMKKLEDLDYKEIADILDIPEGTVKSRLSRAREHLREYFNQKPEFMP